MFSFSSPTPHNNYIHLKICLHIVQSINWGKLNTLHFFWSDRVNMKLGQCSYFVYTCRSETSFVADTLWVHTAMMLSATQIGKTPLRSKKWSKAISEYFPQSVNIIKRNKETGKVKGSSKNSVSFSLFWKSKKVPWFWKKMPWLCPSLG